MIYYEYEAFHKRTSTSVGIERYARPQVDKTPEILKSSCIGKFFIFVDGF